jgi:hypothetical protein
VLYSGALISGAFSGLIAAGVTWGMDGAMGLSAWKWLFIIEGAATVVIAFACYFVLPNFPRTTTWLTDEERMLAIWYVALDFCFCVCVWVCVCGCGKRVGWLTVGGVC